MQGAGSACVGVWEFGLPVGRGEGARRAIRFWGLKELLFTASQAQEGARRDRGDVEGVGRQDEGGVL